MILLEDLDPVFRERLIKVFEEAINHGFKVDPHLGALSIKDQALKWRQSRSDLEIDKALTFFKENDCNFIWNVMRFANAKFGPPVTDCLPGLSWHNWREAIKYDIYNRKTGQVDNDNAEFLEVLKKSMKKHKLHFGVEPRQIQLSVYKDPREIYSLQEIDNKMAEMWGGLSK